MPKQSANPIQLDWLNSGFKGLLGGVICIGIWVFNTNSTSLSKSIEGLTIQLREMEQHQVKTDERVLEIETSRKIGMANYEKVLQDFQDTKVQLQEVKSQLIQVNTRIQTMSDFIVSSFNAVKKHP